MKHQKLCLFSNELSHSGQKVGGDFVVSCILLQRQTVGGNVLKRSEKIVSNKVFMSANKDVNLRCLQWRVSFLCCGLFFFSKQEFFFFSFFSFFFFLEMQIIDQFISQ